jgi:transcriptional regulator with XRE-family HTH domain
MMSDGLVSAAVGRRIRQLRLDAGISPQRLAKQAGLTVSALLSIEAGRTHPSLAALGHVVGHLGVSLSQIVREAQRAPVVAHHSVKSTPEEIGRSVVELPDGLDKLRVAEAAAIRYALEVCKGNQSAAARLLGVQRKALVRRVKRRDARPPSRPPR